MSKKIIFMGTPIFSVPILKSLYQNGFSVESVYTQKPKKSNRGMKMTRSPVHNMAETLGLEVRTPDSLKDNDEELNFFKKINPEIVVVVAYGQILPDKYLSLSKKGFINIHASLLPKWRGAAPIQRSIMSQDKETGISFMKIVKELDAGPVCDSYKIKIENQDNFTSLSEKLSLIAADKILDVVDNIFDDKVSFEDQDHSEASYAKKIEKSEGNINWNLTAKEIVALINGLNGAYFIFKGYRYKIIEAIFNQTNGNPGEVIGNNLEIACKESSIKVLKIQREGKKVQKTSEFLLGSLIKKGCLLNNE